MYHTFTHTQVLVSVLVEDMRWELSKKMNTLINNVSKEEYQLKLRSDKLNDFIREKLKAGRG
jgi:hypothetical protein